MARFEMTGGPDELRAAEIERLHRLEREVRELLGEREGTDLALGRALREVRESRLYRGVERTWDGYCRRRLGRGMTARHANRLIAFARLVDDEMGPRGPVPLYEKQARYLYPLTEDERDEVAERANAESFGRGFDGVTAERVREIAAEVTGAVGAEVVPLDPRRLVLVKGERGIGPVTVGRSGILADLDVAYEAMGRIAARGEHAIPTLIDALERDEVEAVYAKAETVVLVASVFVRRVQDRYGPEPGAQQRMREVLVS